MSMQPKYQTPCSSRVADGLFKGGLMGLSWSIAVDLPQAFSPSKSSLPNVSKTTIKAFTKNSLSFGVFLGTFGGVSCFAETLHGKQDWQTSFAGGFASGLLVSMRLHDPRQILGAACLCGGFAGLMQVFQPQSSL